LEVAIVVVFLLESELLFAPHNRLTNKKIKFLLYISSRGCSLVIFSNSFEFCAGIVTGTPTLCKNDPKWSQHGPEMLVT
jgi:hypothetical protein